MPYADHASNSDLLTSENVKNSVLPFYGLEKSIVSQIKFKDTDKQRAVYKVETGNENFCLKKVYYNANDLLFVYSAIEWLYRNNIHVPRILPTLDHGRFVNYNGMLFILTPWIEGAKCSYDNLEHVRSSSINLAKIHFCSHSFTPISGSAKREGFDQIYTSLLKHFEQLLQCSNNAFKYGDKYSKAFLHYFEDNLILAQTAIQISSSIQNKNLAKSICHLDYVNKNIIFDENKEIWIIDFDKCKKDYCAHDISYFLRRLLKRDKTKWNLEIGIECLELYDKIRPLSFDEYKYIIAYLAFPQKYWKISRDYYNNIKKCNQNSFVTLLHKSVERADYQIEFIKKLCEYAEDKFHQKLNF